MSDAIKQYKNFKKMYIVDKFTAEYKGWNFIFIM